MPAVLYRPANPLTAQDLRTMSQIGASLTAAKDGRVEVSVNLSNSNSGNVVAEFELRKYAANGTTLIGRKDYAAVQKIADTDTVVASPLMRVWMRSGEVLKVYAKVTNLTTPDSSITVDMDILYADWVQVEATSADAIAELKTGLAGLVVSATGANTSDHADAEPTGGVVNTGTNTAGDSDSTWATGTYWQIAPLDTPDADGHTLDVAQRFSLGVTKRANTLRVVAKESFTGSGAAAGVHVWAWSFRTSAWEQLSFIGSGAGGWITGATDAVYTYILTSDHQEQGTGLVSIRFTGTATNTAQYLYLDQVLVNSVISGSGNPTVAEIAEGVGMLSLSGTQAEGTLAYALKWLHREVGEVTVADTAISFTMDGLPAVANAMAGMVLLIENGGADNYREARRIVSHTSAGVVTLDKALSFTPQAGYDVYASFAYCDTAAPLVQRSEPPLPADIAEVIALEIEREKGLLDKLDAARRGPLTVDVDGNLVDRNGTTYECGEDGSRNVTEAAP